MSKQNFLADCRRTVIHAMESATSPPTIELLVSLSSSLDQILPRQIAQAILEGPKYFIEGATSIQEDRQIEVSGRRFEIVACETSTQPKMLDIVFAERGYGIRRKRATMKYHRLTNCGRYKRIRICLPPELQVDTDLVWETAQTALTTGYALLKEKLNSAIANEKVNIASELYEFIRIHIASPALLANLWFASMSEGKCFYLVEPKVAMSSLEIIGPVAHDIGTNPINILAEFITRLTDAELSHAKGVVNFGKCVDVDLQASKYKKVAYLLAQSQMAIFQSTSVSIFPIAHSDDSWLVAFFPTKHRQMIEPVIETHQKELEGIFKKTSHRFAKVTTLYQEARRHFRASKLGEFVGGILKAIVEP